MRNVHEILHQIGHVVVKTTGDHIIAVPALFLHHGHVEWPVGGRFFTAHPDPNQPTSLGHWEIFHPFIGDALYVRAFRGDVHALAAGVVSPAVIRANQAVLVDFPFAQWGIPVVAAVEDGGHLAVLAPPKHQGFFKNGTGLGFIQLEVPDKPAAYQ